MEPTGTLTKCLDLVDRKGSLFPQGLPVQCLWESYSLRKYYAGHARSTGAASFSLWKARMKDACQQTGPGQLVPATRAQRQTVSERGLS